MNNEPRQDLAIYEGGDIQVKRPPELVLEEAMQARRSLERYFHFYNTERIHESLGYKTPYEIYVKERVNLQTKQAA